MLHRVEAHRFGDGSEGYGVRNFAMRKFGYLLVLVAIVITGLTLDSGARLKRQGQTIWAQQAKQEGQYIDVFRTERLHAHNRHEMHAKLVKVLALLQAYAKQDRQVLSYLQVADKLLAKATRTHTQQMHQMLGEAVKKHQSAFAERTRPDPNSGQAINLSDLDTLGAEEEHAAEFQQEAQSVAEGIAQSTAQFSRQAAEVLANAETKLLDAGFGAQDRLREVARSVTQALRDSVKDEAEEERVGRWLHLHSERYSEWLKSEAKRDADRFETRAEADIGHMLKSFHARMTALLKKGDGATLSDPRLALSSSEWQWVHAALKIMARQAHNPGDPSAAEVRVFQKTEQRMEEMMQERGYAAGTRFGDHLKSVFERFENFVRDVELSRAAVSLRPRLQKWAQHQISDAQMLLEIEQKMQEGSLAHDALLGNLDESDNSAESWDHDEDHPDAVGVFKSVYFWKNGPWF